MGLFILSFCIIKKEEDVDSSYAYRGDGGETPGIKIGIKNSNVLEN